jgi:hypothetical protein
MGDPTEVAQKIDPHLHDPAEVDAVFSTLPRSEMNWKMFPAQFQLLFQDESDRDVLQVEVGWNLAQGAPQSACSHQPVGDVWILQVSASGHPQRDPAAKRNNGSANTVIAGSTVAKDTIVVPTLVVTIPEKGRITLTIRIDLENPGGLFGQCQFVAFPACSTMAGIFLVYRSQTRPEFARQTGEDCRGRVGRSIVYSDENKADPGFFQAIKPFPNNGADVGRFVVNRHDDSELGWWWLNFEAGFHGSCL